MGGGPVGGSDASNGQALTPHEAARTYLARGWSVIPTGQDKRPLVPWLPYQDRRATLEEIARWYSRWPQAGVSIVTGAISALSVLDVDPRRGGADTIETKEVPYTATVRTGGLGTHYYFAGALPTRPEIAPGLDLKGEGGYVVAPPSLHPSGRRYEWLVEAMPPAPAPGWLQVLARHPLASGLPGAGFQMPQTIQDGARNDTLYRLACSLRAKGCDETEILVALEVLNQRRCSPPLPEHDLTIIAKSAGRYEPGRDPARGQTRHGKPRYGGYGLEEHMST